MFILSDVWTSCVAVTATAIITATNYHHTTISTTTTATAIAANI
jgi:hypothetical protein